MKKITYQNNKIFTITNQEFSKAIIAWNDRKSFYCVRLEALLPYYGLVETSPDEIGKEVYLLSDDSGGIKKIYKENDNYFVIEKNQDGCEKFYPINLTDEELKKMINQEDYYSQKLYLK